MSGLSICGRKSTLCHNCDSDVLVSLIGDLFAVQAAKIDSGLRYLGFFLKPNCYLSTVELASK